MKKILLIVSLAGFLILGCVLYIERNEDNKEYVIKVQDVDYAGDSVDIKVKVTFPDEFMVNEFLEKDDEGNYDIAVIPTEVYLYKDAFPEEMKDKSMKEIEQFLVNSAKDSGSVITSTVSVDEKSNSVLYKLSFANKEAFVGRKCTLILGQFQLVRTYNSYKEGKILMVGPYFETINLIEE